MSRRVEGVVLLIAGHGADGPRAADASMLHTLGQIGEALLATGASWQVRRLRAAMGDRKAADRTAIKRELDDLAAADVRVAVLVILGAIVELPGGPALITGVDYATYPDDATLPLAWIGDRLRGARADHVLALASARPSPAGLDEASPVDAGDDRPSTRLLQPPPAAPSQPLGLGSAPARPPTHTDEISGIELGDAAAATVPHGPGAWLAALATGRAGDLVGVEASAFGAPLADALLDGLCGDALDPTTGTVTFKSISEFVAREVPRALLQVSMESETVAASPPLAGLWDVRRSQLSQTRPRARSLPRGDGGEVELVGTVLPGRFRVDGIVARGTFGTVYRAHQLAIERDVAIKVLHGDIAPASDDGRLFVHEIRAVGKIDHANVVRIHQADITPDGRLFYAMELLDGRDLQTLVVDGGPLAIARAAGLVRDLLAGLGAAHAAGLVHADIKPANAILLAREGAGERVVLVDFGLARLRQPDRPTESAGGTPAFMAPEQLSEGRVDARSDLFSAALVLVYLVTGWRRTDARQLVPPAGTVAERALAAILDRALAMDPAARYQTAGDFADALARTFATTGEIEDDLLDDDDAREEAAAVAAAIPFRHLEPLTERDSDRIFGREEDIAALVDHAVYGRTVIYTAASGTGKTSLLRAGLAPRLDTLGITAVYLRCRDEPVAPAIAALIAASTALASAPELEPGPRASFASIAAAASRGADVSTASQARATLDAAIADHHARRRRPLVIVLDQLEAALANDEASGVVAVLTVLAARTDVTSVFGVREDHLARLVAHTHAVDPGTPIVRLPPLRPDGARDAIVQPLARARLAIEPELQAALLGDLERAAVALGRELGWGDARAVYPPHLQLACSVLCEALAPGEAMLTLAHYRALGGFEAIVGEYLERVLDELADDRVALAREILVALVTATNERAAPTETALVEGARGEPGAIAEVLEVLRARGILVRVRGGGEARWELVHDSLVPRVLAWLDRTSLARRRAVELVRYHVRRSRPDAPSLLGRAELRELRAHADAIAELDREYREREAERVARESTSSTSSAPAEDAATLPAVSWLPLALVARSRAVLVRRVLTSVGVVLGLSGLATAGFVRSQRAEAASARQAALRTHDFGHIAIALEAFDWDPATNRARPASAAAMTWTLHHPAPDDALAAGAPYGPDDLDGSFTDPDGFDARGGAAVLVVTRAGCTRSHVPILLPGYTKRRDDAEVLHVRVPTCAATVAGTIAIPAGPFLYGGAGEPPAFDVITAPADNVAETKLDLAAFALDRTEVTNAAYDLFVADSAGAIAAPQYPNIESISRANAPVSSIEWAEAAAYCAFMGKRLPRSEEWQKALRGGLALPDGTPNPHPRRNYPWGVDPRPRGANVKGILGTDAQKSGATSPVAAFPDDTSPYGIVDLAGNVSEWTSQRNPNNTTRTVRGGGWGYTTNEVDTDYSLVNFDAIENQRLPNVRTFDLGARCARDP